jgi:hypothetical protein
VAIVFSRVAQGLKPNVLGCPPHVWASTWSPGLGEQIAETAAKAESAKTAEIADIAAKAEITRIAAQTALDAEIARIAAEAAEAAETADSANIDGIAAEAAEAAETAESADIDMIAAEAAEAAETAGISQAAKKRQRLDGQVHIVGAGPARGTFLSISFESHITRFGGNCMRCVCVCAVHGTRLRIDLSWFYFNTQSS